MQSSDIPVSEQIENAADILEQRGWRRGPDGWLDYTGEGGRVCIEGAMQAALGISHTSTVGPYHREEFEDCPMYRAVAEYIRPDAPLFGEGQLWRWNDLHARGKQHVLDTLRGAAKAQRIKEEA